MALIFLSLHKEALSKGGEIFMIVIGVVLALMPFYVVYRFYQNAPTIRVNSNSISFNDTAPCFWADLEKFEMTGKRPFKFMLSDPKEGVLLKFKGQKEKYILDDMYENTPEIKKLIGSIVENTLSSKVPANSADLGVLDDNSFTYYKGYQLLCFEGIFRWLFFMFMAFFIISVIWSGLMAFAIGLLILGVFFYAMMGFRLYYFGVSPEHLVIRLHNIFWYRKFYPLADIREVVFETHYKMPVCLRVITNDFESKMYPAGSIWSKKWLQLKEDFEKKNIKVRNECVTYEPFEFKLYN
ncbi:hypothetical protein [uncultured Mucilaginibacter sp.]|uniref:hypothetical protein n=1 Tax=uncultured Mucilaginibacter sp. TaxID=797541 RepID=UPI0025F5BE87|nr:hypothetical protein [uncultured Mucilaginibacter sp.]